jgi:hypothetical protein
MAELIEFTSIGNYRIISWNQPFKNVQSFNGWIIDVSGENPPSIFLFLEYRWSVNGSNWSLWSELTSQSVQNIPISPDNPFYIEIRLTASSDENASPYYPPGTPLSPPMVLNDFELDLTYKTVDPRDLMNAPPSPLCSKELTNYPIVFSDCNFTFRPYDVNRAINIYQDLSKIVNNVFGHEVVYYSVQPQGRGKDVVLKEYTLFDVVDEKCIKVMVPNNQFPDAAVNFETFGLNFNQPFEIHIDRKYFEGIFGKGSQPRKRDIIYFPLTNRIYRIDSMYVFRDINNYPVYFKIQLTKYEIQKNTSWNDTAAQSELHDYTVNTQQLFGEDVQNQETELTKPQQYVVTSQRRLEDPIRSYINKNLPIIEYDLNNNWTIVFNNYYDLNSIFIDDPNTIDPVSPDSGWTDEERDAVRWKADPVLTASDERSFMCWFRTRNYIDKSKLVFRPPSKISITIDNIGSGEITYTTYPVSHGLHIRPNPNGYVSILADGVRSGGFEITEIVDAFRFKVKDAGAPAPVSTSGWKVQKAQSRILFDGYYNGQGLYIDFIWSGSNATISPVSNNYLQVGSFRIRINNLEISSPFGAGISSTIGQFIPTEDDWYGFVFNFSNVFRQYSIKVWSLTYNPDNPATQTSDLSLVHSFDGVTTQSYTFNIPPVIETNFDSPFYGTNNFSYKTRSCPLWVTNFRFFKYMVEEEKQSAILNQNIIDDAQLAIIIDNAKPTLKLPKVARNR